MRQISYFDLGVLASAYAFRLFPRKASGAFGYERLYSEKRIAHLLQQHYLTQFRSNDESVLRLSKEGLSYLSSALGVPLSDSLTETLQGSLCNNVARKRQLRLSWMTAMINRFVPALPYEYLEITSETKLQAPLFTYYNSRPLVKPASDARETLRHLAAMKSLESPTNSYAILLKEFHLIDPEKTRNLSYIRTMGILHLAPGDFSLYNVKSTCMVQSSQSEAKILMYYRSCLQKKEDSTPAAIIMGKSFQPVYRYFRLAPEHRNLLMLGRNFPLYHCQYYVLLNSNGAKQLYLLSIPSCRDKIQAGLLPAEEIARSQNNLADGLDEFGNISFLGFDCDICRIEQLLDMMHSFWMKRSLTIFCFPWQANFYYTLFSPNCNIRLVQYSAISQLFPDYFPVPHMDLRKGMLGQEKGYAAFDKAGEAS